MDQPLSLSTDASAITIEPPDPAKLAEQLDALINSPSPPQQKTDTLLRTAVGLVNAAGIVFFHRRQQDLVVSAHLLSRQTAQWSADPVAECRNKAGEALGKGQAIISPLQNNPAVSVLCCPVPGGENRADHCLCVLVVLGGNPAEPYLIVLQLITSVLVQISTGQRPLELPQLLSRLDIADGWQLEAWLKQWLQCSILAIGTVDAQTRLRVRFISGVASADKRTHRTRLFSKVMLESLDAAGSLFWPLPDAGNEQFSQSLLLKELVQEGGANRGAAVCLSGAGQAASVRVVLVMLWHENSVAAAARLAELKACEKLLSPAWYLLLRDGGKRRPDGAAGKFSSVRKAVVTVATLALLGWFALYPMQFNLHPDALVEPVQVRFLVSKFDALIEEVFVEPGDTVRQDQELVSLDGREIELELASIAADSAKALKMRDNHHVLGDVAAAQIAQLEYQRLQERAKLLSIRQTQLRLASPIDGMVLSGDLKRRLGGPVSKGQVLLELAPLETVLLEMAISDEDIGHIEIGQSVSVHFDAFPQRTWQGRITDISPKSQLVQGKNVFVASFELVNSDKLLQPGMQGKAFVACGTRSPAWIYFHKPWYATLNLLRSVF